MMTMLIFLTIKEEFTGSTDSNKLRLKHCCHPFKNYLYSIRLEGVFGAQTPHPFRAFILDPSLKTATRSTIEDTFAYT